MYANITVKYRQKIEEEDVEKFRKAGEGKLNEVFSVYKDGVVDIISHELEGYDVEITTEIVDE
jgi:hypothetical protein